MAKTGLLLLVIVLAGCRPTVDLTASLQFGEACTVDASCVSGRCMGKDEGRYCSVACDQDAGCRADDTLYCCNHMGDRAWCMRTDAETCQQPSLGDPCRGPDDPYCVRGGFECVDLQEGERVCSRECASAADCSEAPGATCDTFGSRTMCAPIDVDKLPRLKSNCSGDRDSACLQGELCQIVYDNPIDRRALVTVCSDLRYAPGAAYSPCTADASQCDRYFCLDGYCPATCANDAWCAPGFHCIPLRIGVRGDDPSTPGDETIVSVVGMCTPQHGSFAPCDHDSPACSDASCSNSNCPLGESCQYAQRFDGATQSVCATVPTLTHQTAPVVTGEQVGGQCSSLSDHDNDAQTPRVRQPIGGNIVACNSGACFAPGYCGSPCRQESDCCGDEVGCPPSEDYSGEAMTCVYLPFQQQCARVNLSSAGAALGASCTAATLDQADLNCASLYCDAGQQTPVCAARKGPGQPCSRPDECVSLTCVSGTCRQPCRDDSGCGAFEACAAQPFVVDVFNTPAQTLDDRVDLPTFCEPLPGRVQDPLRGACHGVSACAGACRAVMTHSGGLRGLCADPLPGGLAVGEACKEDNGCATRLCLGVSEDRKVCTVPCDLDADCGPSLRCVAVSLFGTELSRVCLPPVGASARGSACAKDLDCEQALCVEGTCSALCTGGIGCGGPNEICMIAALPVDARSTEETFDDFFGYVEACAAVTECSAAPTSCPAGKSCVFRPTPGGNLRGYCLTPSADGFAAGEVCQFGSSCKSGLCVDGICATPCTETPSDTCTGTQRCHVQARARLGERGIATATVSACATPCTDDAECTGGKTCAPAPEPRFCE